jgi:hypothetical protein
MPPPADDVSAVLVFGVESVGVAVPVAVLGAVGDLAVVAGVAVVAPVAAMPPDPPPQAASVSAVRVSPARRVVTFRSGSLRTGGCHAHWVVLSGEVFVGWHIECAAGFKVMQIST